MRRNPVIFTFLSVLAVLSLSGCGDETAHYMVKSWEHDYSQDQGKLESGDYMFTKPFQLRGIPQDDSSYSQGMRDGCNTMIGAAGDGILRSHGFAYDVNRGLSDRDYYRGYQVGSRHCLYFVDREPL